MLFLFFFYGGYTACNLYICMLGVYDMIVMLLVYDMEDEMLAYFLSK